MREHKKINTQKSYQSEWNSFLRYGNMDALSVIYEDNFDLLLNYGRKFCQEEALIEDAIQNIFTNIIRSRDKLGEISSIKQYLIVAHRNEIFELVSKKRNIIDTENIPDILFIPEYSTEEKIVEQEGQARMKKFLRDCLQKLTPHQQEILYLKYDVGLSYNDISKTLNISVESCRTSIFRSIKLIRADIESLKKRKIQLFFSIFRNGFKKSDFRLY